MFTLRSSLSTAARFGGALLLASSLAAVADQVTIDTTGVSAPVFNSSNALLGWGGEFAATETGVTLSPLYAAGGTGNPSNGSFITFCVELNQDLYANTSYTYGLSNNLDFTNSTSEPLTLGVAWLYSQFVQGTLYGYTYPTGAQLAGSPATTLSQAESTAAGDSSLDLQYALWALQGETLGTDNDNPTVIDMAGNLANPFIQLVAQEFGGGVYTVGGSTANEETALGGALVASNGAYGVEVMNLASGGQPAQNQLILVPDGGWTVALFGIAVLGLALLRRPASESATLS